MICRFCHYFRIILPASKFNVTVRFSAITFVLTLETIVWIATLLGAVKSIKSNTTCYHEEVFQIKLDKSKSYIYLNRKLFIQFVYTYVFFKGIRNYSISPTIACVYVINTCSCKTNKTIMFFSIKEPGHDLISIFFNILKYLECVKQVFLCPIRV